MYALACSGLDNAGKTTIVKRINGEDITTVSPTLGFNIKTMEYNGCVIMHWPRRADMRTPGNWCMKTIAGSGDCWWREFCM